MAMNLLVRCNDLAETRAYYRDCLGFDIAETAESTVTATKSGGTLIFTDRDLWKSPPHFTGTIYFFVPDVDGFHDAVKDKAQVAWPVQDMPYGLREFGIQDCNGYVLAFARRIRA
jgi:catechol 2,3-dioxygenase-like lactoylglutathione lyase family enzyme